MLPHLRRSVKRTTFAAGGSSVKAALFLGLRGATDAPCLGACVSRRTVHVQHSRQHLSYVSLKLKARCTSDRTGSKPGRRLYKIAATMQLGMGATMALRLNEIWVDSYDCCEHAARIGWSAGHISAGICAIVREGLAIETDVEPTKYRSSESTQRRPRGGFPSSPAE